MVRSGIKFTYEDYRSLPESETKRYELLEGELVVAPSPNERHQSVSRNLEFLLFQFVKDNNLGTIYFASFDVHLGDNVLQPHIMYISRDRLSIITRDEIHGPPDLVIETLSPATAARDRNIKRTVYARRGVRELWIVDPEGEAIEVAKLGKAGLETTGIYKKGETLRSHVLPGFRPDLREVFQKP
ncbi:MAG: Uma2 family endonuclease [Chloroflexi bacterium]|nr:Uma2 family endonuclease [Chloroflexota bacterium]